MLTVIRWAVAVPLGAFSLWGIAFNWWCYATDIAVLLHLVPERKRPSMVFFGCAFFGVAALAVCPLRLPHWCVLLPFALDPTCVLFWLTLVIPLQIADRLRARRKP